MGAREPRDAQRRVSKGAVERDRIRLLIDGVEGVADDEAGRRRHDRAVGHPLPLHGNRRREHHGGDLLGVEGEHGLGNVLRRGLGVVVHVRPSGHVDAEGVEAGGGAVDVVLHALHAHDPDAPRQRAAADAPRPGIGQAVDDAAPRRHDLAAGGTGRAVTEGVEADHRAPEPPQAVAQRRTDPRAAGDDRVALARQRRAEPGITRVVGHHRGRDAGAAQEGAGDRAVVAAGDVRGVRGVAAHQHHQPRQGGDARRRQECRVLRRHLLTRQRQ